MERVSSVMGGHYSKESLLLQFLEKKFDVIAPLYETHLFVVSPKFTGKDYNPNKTSLCSGKEKMPYEETLGVVRKCTLPRQVAELSRSASVAHTHTQYSPML